MSEVYETIKRGLEDAVNGRVTEHTVEYAPVVHGEWIQMNGHKYCNVCWHKDSPILTNYCPNCGAKMDGERRERRGEG